MVTNDCLRSQLSRRFLVKRFGELSKTKPEPALPGAPLIDGRISRPAPGESIELRLPPKKDPSSAVDVS